MSWGFRSLVSSEGSKLHELPHPELLFPDLYIGANRFLNCFEVQLLEALLLLYRFHASSRVGFSLCYFMPRCWR